MALTGSSKWVAIAGVVVGALLASLVTDVWQTGLWQKGRGRARAASQ